MCDLNNGGKVKELILVELIEEKIYMIRGHKVMVDRDLAKMYGVETRLLNQAVRRNLDRFPDDFMFALTRDEIMNLSQLVISSRIKHAPNVFVFAEQGVAMLSSVLNSYTPYFNLKNKRKGPLWESKFKNVEVETDEQLIHLTRYLHLNPVTANLVEDPGDRSFSSYKEYLGEKKADKQICNYSTLLHIVPEDYRKFVSSGKTYQRELAVLKTLFIEC
jgi:hypothetical protein